MKLALFKLFHESLLFGKSAVDVVLCGIVLSYSDFVGQMVVKSLRIGGEDCTGMVLHYLLQYP